MTNYDAAQEWLAGQNLTWRLARLPRKFRDGLVEAYVLNRCRYSGEGLQRRMREHVQKMGVVPVWLIAPLLDMAVRLMFLLLERWWDKRGKETIQGHA